jgi:N-acetylneuraminic acid mutarotase
MHLFPSLRPTTKTNRRSLLSILPFCGLLIALSPGNVSVASAQDWVLKANMPSARTHGCAVVVDQKIYVIGGVEGELTPHSDLWVYDPVTDSWDTSKAPMPTARGSMGCAEVDGKIYVIGGANTLQLNPIIYSVVEMYDPMTDTWTTRMPLSIKTAAPTVSAINGKIYAFGGLLTELDLLGTARVREYDPVTDTWTRKTNKPLRGWGQSSSLLDGKIYVTGGTSAFSPASGNEPTAALEVYDPISDSWDTSMAPMLTGRYSHAISVVDGIIYAMGGFRHAGNFPPYNTVEQYDLITDSWIQKSDLPLTLAGVSTAVFDGKIYLFGGTSTGHFFTETNTVFEYLPADATDVEGENIPKQFTLNQNYPNPFNPTTTFSYALPQSSDVTIKVYDALGRSVRILVSGIKPAGIYTESFDAAGLPSGTYFYRFEAGDYVEVQKMVVMK